MKLKILGALFLVLQLSLQLACTSSNANSPETKLPTSNSPSPNSGGGYRSPNDGTSHTTEPPRNSSDANMSAKVLSTSHGRLMAYDYVQGSRAPVWLLIHGLGDDMSKMEGIARLVEQAGYSVLRVDLQGHGETLKQYLNLHRDLPAELNYQDNVEDIEDVLRALQIRELVIVGHSYGGAIAYALAADLSQSGLAKVQSLHLLAPYVQRIDKFLRGYYGTPVFPGTDQILEPMFDQALSQTYRSYFLQESNEIESQLSEAQRQALNIKVRAAVLATKGIRNFDLLDASVPFLKVQIPLQILGGEQDSLVIPAQLKAFDQRLSSEQIPHTLEFLVGEKATHQFPQNLPSVVWERLQKFQGDGP